MNTKNKKSSLNRKQRKIRKYTNERIKEVDNYDDREWSTTYFDDLLECNVYGGNTDDILYMRLVSILYLVLMLYNRVDFPLAFLIYVLMLIL